MPALFSNNASATLASSISVSATAITVSTGMGALFPTITAGTYFYATLTDSSNNLEIVKVTGRTSDTMTVVRAQEGTTARAYAAADKIELRVTTAVLNNLVQLDGAQTITGVKTFSAACDFGTPSAITLTNATGLPVSTGISGLGANVAATFLATPSSANLVAAVTDETGSGSLVFGTSPTLTSPTLTSATVGLAGNPLTTTNFTVQESGSKLVFKYGTTTIASLDSAGVFTTLSDITAGGTP